MRNELVSDAGSSNGKMIFRLGILTLCLAALLIAMAPPQALGQSVRSDFGAVVPPIQRGIVIANGLYVPPPYEIELIDKELVVNGTAFRPDQLNLMEFEHVEFDDKPSWGPHRGEGMRRSRRFRMMPDPIEQLWDACRATANMDGIIVLSNGQAPLLLDRSGAGNDLLAALLRNSSDSPASMELPYELSAPLYREALDQAIAEFKPSPEFRRRAGAYVSEIVAADAAGEKIVKASLWADSISYPLTLFAMIVVVVAFGHLLSNKPRLEEGQAGSGVSPEAQKVVLKSLLIFGLLSVVDLIWTISANATGSMREMNPLGQELIDDPIRLILFKTLAVSLTIGLLYSLHRRPIAQVASWWSCLVLTLLTARWLTFHSMFM